MQSTLIDLWKSFPSHLQCDKGWTHAYLYAYTFLMAPYRHEPINFCEFGVAGGQSHYMWDQYFTHPDTKIFGLDINLKQLDNRVSLSPRVKLIEANINDINSTELANYKFDLVIDDGPHSFPSQKIFFEFFQPRLNNNGLLVIEDVLDIKVMKDLLDLHKTNFYIDTRNIHRWQLQGSDPTGFVPYDLIMCHYNVDYPDFWQHYSFNRPSKIDIEI